MDVISKAKGNKKLLGQRRNQRRARAKAFKAALEAWLHKYSRFQVKQETERIKGVFAKAQDESTFREQLLDIMRMYGMREMGDAANRAVGRQLIKPELIREASAGKPTRVSWFWEYDGQIEQRVTNIMEDTKKEVNRQVNTIVTEALTSDVRPSVGEVARRIRTQLYGVRTPSQELHAPGKGSITFSSARAELIARTELGQAQNSGAYEGYKRTGVKRIKWLAYNDGKSGDRQHNKMNGKIIEVGGVFITPLGNPLRYPGDPNAKIKETANCRCTVAPVV